MGSSSFVRENGELTHIREHVSPDLSCDSVVPPSSGVETLCSFGLLFFVIECDGDPGVGFSPSTVSEGVWSGLCSTVGVKVVVFPSGW